MANLETSRALPGTHDNLSKIYSQNKGESAIPKNVARIHIPDRTYLTIAPTLDSTGTIRVGFQVDEPQSHNKDRGTQRYSYFIDRHDQVKILTAQRFTKTPEGIVDDPTFIPPSADVLLEEVKAAAGFRRPHLFKIPEKFVRAFKNI
jgi:hypothetical protein